MLTTPAASVEQVTPGLLRVSGRMAGWKAMHQHVLLGDDLWLWIDAGIASTPDDFLLDALPSKRAARQLLVVTHADVDHFGGIRRLQAELPGLLVAAHARDADWIEQPGRLMRERYRAREADGVALPTWRQDELRERGGGGASVDVRLIGGEVFDLGRAGRWEVLHVPGHTPGHLVLWNDAERVAITGDAVLGWGVPDLDGNLRTAPPYYDVAAYLGTLDLLASLAPRTLLSSHWPRVDGPDVLGFAAESRAAVEAIGAAVTRATRGGTTSLPDLCQAVGRSVGRWAEDAWPGLADPIAAHLAYARGAP